MADNDDNLHLVDLLDDEDLTDEERRRAEQLLEDDDVRREVDSHRQLLQVIRDELDGPEVSQQLHDDIVDYARQATADSASSGQDATGGASVDGDDTTKVIYPFSAQTAAVAAALIAVIGGIAFVSLQSVQTPAGRQTSREAASAEQTGDSPSGLGGPLAEGRQREKTERKTEMGVPPDVSPSGDNPPRHDDAGQTALTDKRSGPGRPDSSSADTSSGAIGSGTRLADKDRAESTSDDRIQAPPKPDPSEVDPEPSPTIQTEGAGDSSNGSPKGGAASRAGVGTGSLSKDQSDPTPKAKSKTRAADDGDSQTPLLGKQESFESYDSSSRNEPTHRARQVESRSDASSSPSSDYQQRVTRMVTAMRTNRPADALHTADHILGDPTAKTIDVEVGSRPSRTAHYYALEYKLRALINLERWSDARSTLAVLRELYRDDTPGVVDTLAERIPQASPKTDSPADAPASTTSE